jgi:two-component system nitrate/nitrite response regulator NarL
MNYKRKDSKSDRPETVPDRLHPDGDTRVRVVIADDHPGVLDQIRRLLSPHFNVVGYASNGRELFEAVMTLYPSIAITDITMPVMNGLEATSLIRKVCPRVKVVALSVHDDAETINAALEAGASAYVSKARAYEDLIPTIERVLSGRLHRSRGLG